MSNRLRPSPGALVNWVAPTLVLLAGPGTVLAQCTTAHEAGARH